MKKIITIISVVAFLTLPFVSYADTADWTATCTQYLNQVVSDPTSQACDLNGDGLVNGDDFTLAYSDGAMGQIELPAPAPIDTVGNAGIPSGFGSQLYPGWTNCSQYSSTCLTIMPDGSWNYYPNPQFNAQ